MDGVYEIIPGSVPVEVARRTWTLAPWTLADDAEVERRILAKCRRPLDVAREMIEGQPEHLQRHILALAYAEECSGRRATRGDLLEWLETREGQLIEFWLRARKNHKELTLEDVERLFSAEAAASANAQAAERSGERPLGNSPSPGAAGDRDQPVPWRTLLRRLVAIGIRPADVGNLTWTQVRILLDDLDDRGRTIAMAPEEAAPFAARRRELRNRWIEQQLRITRGE